MRHSLFLRPPILGAATTIGGLSVAPDNSKIAVTGFNTGKVRVYDYAAGNGVGTGSPALSGLRQSAPILGTGANYSSGSQQGTAWKDNFTVLAFSGEGSLYEVDANTMATTLKQTVAVSPTAQKSTSLAYNPAISPYVYALFSSRSNTNQIPANTVNNTLFVFDPANAYNDLTGGGIDFSRSANVIRDIALDSSGNLFLATGSSTRLEYIPGAAAHPAAIVANSSVDWYFDEVVLETPAFVGIDIGFAAVPEPRALALFAFALVGFNLHRRRPW